MNLILFGIRKKMKYGKQAKKQRQNRISTITRGCGGEGWWEREEETKHRQIDEELMLKNTSLDIKLHKIAEI